MIWATVSSQSCFCWLYRASPSLATKNIINLISTIWSSSYVESSLVLLEEVDKGLSSPTQIHLVKAMVFTLVMYGCESWTIKKTEHQRIDAFELWCWRRLMRVPWTARRSNQSVLKEISSEYSLERLMLKLKLQHFDHRVKNWLIIKDPDARKDWRQEKGTIEDEMIGWHHRLYRHGFEQVPGVGDGQGNLACCSPWNRKESDTTEQLKWAELNFFTAESPGKPS